jgi:hypothetical protein
VSNYGLDDRATEVRGKRIFPVTSVSRPAMGSTQHPVQWVAGLIFPGLTRGRGVTLTTHPHLVPKSRMSRSYTSAPPCVFVGVLWDCFTFQMLPGCVCLVTLFEGNRQRNMYHTRHILSWIQDMSRNICSDWTINDLYFLICLWNYFNISEFLICTPTEVSNLLRDWNKNRELRQFPHSLQ